MLGVKSPYFWVDTHVSWFSLLRSVITPFHTYIFVFEPFILECLFLWNPLVFGVKMVYVIFFVLPPRKAKKPFEPPKKESDALINQQSYRSQLYFWQPKNLEMFQKIFTHLAVFRMFFPSYNQGWFQGPPIMGPPYGKLPILFPYHSHKNP